MTDKNETKLVATVKDPLTNRQVINLKALDKATANKVAGLSMRLEKAVESFGKSGLEIGKILFEGRELLKPKDLFLPWLNTIPGFSTATAYRMIDRYVMANRLLPSSVVSQAMAAGIEISGHSEEQPFGRYTQAVAEVGQLEKDATPEQQNQWLTDVVATYKKQKKSVRAEASSYDQLLKSAYTSFCNIYKKVPEKEQVKFVDTAFSYILNFCGFQSWTGKGKTPPQIIKAEKPKKEKKAKKEKKESAAASK